MVRLKNRYLMTEVIWHDIDKSTPLSESWLFSFVANETKEKIGELTFEAFKKTLKFIYVNPDTNIFIIRVQFEYYKSLWTVLSLITSYYGSPIYFRTIHVGGSIKCCQKAAIKQFGKQISIFDKNQIIRKDDDEEGDEEDEDDIEIENDGDEEMKD